MKIPNRKDALKCIEIKKKWKRHEELTQEEDDFLMEIHNKFSEWYHMDDEIIWEQEVSLKELGLDE